MTAKPRSASADPADPAVRAPLRLALCGLGAWGRNLARAFDALGSARLELICDPDPAAASEARRFAGARLTPDYGEVLASDVAAVALAVPAPLHYAMAREALEAGKHVFVEKPMTLAVGEAEALTELAEARSLTLMVGHLLVYHPAVEAMKGMIAGGELGELYYMSTRRVNLGVVRRDENALWSLAPHDFAVILHLFDEEPESVAARGECFLQPGVEDVVFVNLRFASGRMAQLHVSWLDPRKERRMVLVGSRRMVEFDDMEPAEKLRVYDKGAEVERNRTTDMIEAIRVRHGEVRIPLLSGAEPLALETAHFVDCALGGRRPLSDGRAGLRVTRLLNAAEASMRRGGEPVAVADKKEPL